MLASHCRPRLCRGRQGRREDENECYGQKPRISENDQKRGKDEFGSTRKCGSDDPARFRSEVKTVNVVIRNANRQRLAPDLTVSAAIHFHNSTRIVAYREEHRHRFAAESGAGANFAERLLLCNSLQEPWEWRRWGGRGLRHAHSAWPRRGSCECHSRILAPAREEVPARWKIDRF
jgi:hypothetical protein